MAIPLGLLMFYSHRLEKETERFYESRPILQTMREASLGQPTVYPPPAAKVLLTALPTGTGAPTATLETERFSCKKTIPSVASGATKKMQEWADEIRKKIGAPQELPPVGMGSNVSSGGAFKRDVHPWIIDLEFGKSDRLVGAKVGTWGHSILK